MSNDLDRYRMRAALRWADIDANFHVRHTVYYDLGSEQRIRMLGTAGVTLGYMQEHSFGPVLFREECRFLREVRIEDAIDVELRISGLSRDFRKFGFQHRFLRGEEVCAIVRVEGAWFNAATRKVFVPPQLLIDVLEHTPRTEDFAWM
jgi:acyl-CoA thioester hydrolase